MKIVVHYAEIGLKGRNRPRFEERLRLGLQRVLAPVGPVTVAHRFGRLLVELPDSIPFDQVKTHISRCFGVAYYGRVSVCAPSLEALESELTEFLRQRKFASFGIRARRAEKRHPFRSSDIARQLGQFVASQTGARVDLRNPDQWIDIHVLTDEALILHERIPGPGGMPTGSAGRASCLISGGIDSPVASYELMKRGASLDFIHFHSAPFTSGASVDKVRDLVGRLARYQGPSTLFIVPFGELQTELVQEAPAEPRIVLYRRFMLRIAEVLAHRRRGLALITGESLGQVSSQTLANLDTINRVATLPVLRPLIGMDKQEIISRAQQIDTFDISIEPDDDCCSYLMPARPATFTRPDRIDRIESKLDVAHMVERTVERVQQEIIEPEP